MISQSKKLLVLGDSVPWGQGLQEPEKYYYKVGKALGFLSVIVEAHSGATIGVDDSTIHTPCNEEVPLSYPTILQQVDNVTEDPASIAVILVNGGINDVDIRVIMSPWTTTGHLSDLIYQHCYSDMGKLLSHIVAKFNSPATSIIVTDYYPILSYDSHRLKSEAYLNSLCISIPKFDNRSEIQNIIFDRSLQFWHESTKWIKAAVDDTSKSISGGPSVHFVDGQFHEENAMFASKAWLFGLKGPFLSPEDPVANTRRPYCDGCFKTDLLQREQCYRASAGHPNANGAVSFANAILKSLNVSSS